MAWAYLPVTPPGVLLDGLMKLLLRAGQNSLEPKTI